MGLFSDGYESIPVTESFAGEVDFDALVEAFLVDEVNHTWTDAQVAEFCAPGGVGEALVEAKVLNKKTLVRLSKKDDLDRRRTMAAMELAKQNNDPLFQKLLTIYAKKDELKSKIIAKYGNKAERVAIAGQKEYIKRMKKVPSSFMKFGGAERV